MIRNRDTKFTKLFVGGIPYGSDDEKLREFFSEFGEIEEAVVIKDRLTKRSKGYGFVTMATSDAAELACRNKRPFIDGRQANVNLAYLGAKPKPAKMPGKMSPCPTYSFQPGCTLSSAPQYVYTPLYSPTHGPSPSPMSPLPIIPPQSPNGQLATAMPTFQQPCYVDYGGGAMVVFNAVYDSYYYSPTPTYVPSPTGNNNMSQVFTFPTIPGPATPPLNAINGAMNGQNFFPGAPFELIGQPQVQCQ